MIHFRRFSAMLLSAILMAMAVLSPVGIGTVEAATTIEAYNDPVKAWPSFMSYSDRNGNDLYDPANEPGISPDDVDFMSGALKGSGDKPSYYVGGDGSHLFFRMRLLGDPRDDKGGFLSSVWMVHVLVNGVHKATVGLNGKSPHEDYIYVANSSGTLIKYVNKTVGGNVVPGTRVEDDGSGNYFLDVQVPISRLTEIDSTITSASIMQFRFATSKAANLSVINKDGMDQAGGYVKASPFALYKPAIAFSGLAGSYAVSPSTISGTTAHAANSSAVTLTITSSTTGVAVGSYSGQVQGNAWSVGSLPNLNGGSYMVKASVTNENGDTAVTSQKVDIGAAKITINGKAEYKTFTFPMSFTGTHDRSDNGQRGVNLSVYKLSGPNLDIKTLVASKSSINVTGNNPGSWNSGTLTYSGLETGYTYRLEAVDSINSTVMASQTITYVTGSIAITSPADNTRSQNATPLVTGTTNPNQKVSLYIDNVLFSETKADGSGVWSILIDNPLSRNVSQTDYHLLKAVITDEGSNTREVSVHYGVDTYSISIENGSDSGQVEWIYTTSLEPVIRGRSTDSLVNVTIAEYGQPEAVYSAENVTVTGGKWSIKVPAGKLANLKDYQVTAVAVHDTSKTAELYMRMKISTSLDITSPVSGSTVDVRRSIQGTAEPNAIVELHMNSTSIETVSADTNGSWTYTPASDWTLGANHVWAVTSDVAGNTAEDETYFKVSLNPGLSAPTVIITEDGNNDGYINQAELSGKVGVKAVLPNGVAPGYEVRFSDGTVAEAITLDAAKIAAGYVEAEFDAPAHDVTLTVTAILVAGAVESQPGQDQAVMKTTGPTVPTVDVLTTSDTTPTLTGTADGGTLTVSVNGVTHPEGPDLTRNGTNWSLTIPSAFPGGTYPVTAIVTDTAGNTATDVTTDELKIVTGIEYGPLHMTAQTDTGTSQSDRLTKYGMPVLYFTGHEGLVITLKGPGGGVLTEGDHYSVSYEDGTYTVTLLDAKANEDGPQPFGTYSQGAATLNEADMADGIYTIEAADLLGNKAVVGTFELDTTEPAVPTVTPKQTSDTTPEITGQAVGETLTVLVNGVTYPEGPDLTRNGTNWSLTIPSAIPGGTYPVTAIVTDTAGNTATDVTTDELKIVTGIEYGPLHMTAQTDTGTSQSDRLTKHGTPVLYFTGQEGLIITLKGPGGGVLTEGTNYSVSYANGTYTVTLLDAKANEDGPQPFGTYSQGAATLNEADMADGIYTIEAHDLLGNKAVVGTFELDTTAPAVPTVTPQRTNDATPEITGQAIGETLTVLVNGATYAEGPDLTRNGTNWSLVVPAAMPLGTYSVQATVTDRAGNAATDVTNGELTIASVEDDLLLALKEVNIRYSPGDIWESVTLPVFLARDGTYETVIGWTSNNTNVVNIIESPDPNYPDEYVTIVNRSNDKDVSVRLTARVSKGGQHIDRTFLLVVKSRVVLEAKDIDETRSDNPIEGAKATRTTLSNGNLIDKLIVTESAMDELLLDSGTGNVAFTFNDKPQGEDRADELAVEIPIKALSKVSNTKSINIETPLATIQLPQASVTGMKESGSDLYFRVVPIRNAASQDEIYSAALQDNQVKAEAGGKRIETLGEPKKIETNYEGYATELTLPFTNVTVPSDPAEQSKFLASLRVYIQHSDGTNRIAGGSDPLNYPSVIVYNNGQPVGIKFTIQKFSTFSLFRIVENTPVAAAPVQQPEIKVVAAKILDPRSKIDVELNGNITTVSRGDFTVTVGGRPAEVVIAEVSEGKHIIVQLSKPIPLGQRVIVSHSGYPIFTIEIMNGVIHKNYIAGYPDGQFKPLNTITRAEIAAMLARLTVDGGETKAAKPAFTDVAPTHWAAGYVETVRVYNIMEGYSDGTFRMQRTITRAEIAAVIARFLGLSGSKAAGPTVFSDIGGHWAENDIALLEERGITLGENGRFNPDRGLTRAEAVTIINRAINRGILTGDFKPSWPDVPSSYWAYGHIEEASRTHEATRINDGEELWMSHPDQH